VNYVGPAPVIVTPDLCAYSWHVAEPCYGARRLEFKPAEQGDLGLRFSLQVCAGHRYGGGYTPEGAT